MRPTWCAMNGELMGVKLASFQGTQSSPAIPNLPFMNLYCEHEIWEKLAAFQGIHSSPVGEVHSFCQPVGRSSDPE